MIARSSELLWKQWSADVTNELMRHIFSMHHHTSRYRDILLLHNHLTKVATVSGASI